MELVSDLRYSCCHVALTLCVCRLENALRNFACLTTGDVIAINYNEKVSVSTVGPAGPGAQVSRGDT